MSVRIGLGLSTQPFSGPAALLRWAQLCDEQGVDSLWQTDRLVSREASLEPVAWMAALAGATSRVKFGMNAVVVTTRDPLVLAKQCATIDFLSDGRLLPVFGVGNASAPEWRATGRDPAGRGRRADEALEIMRRLWAGEQVDFDGEHFHYRGARISPLPAQQPLPLWIGGSSRAAIRRSAQVGSGWLGGVQTPEQVAPVIAAIREAARARGRALADDHFGATFGFRIGVPDDAVAARLRARFAGAAKSGGGGERSAGAVPGPGWAVIGSARDVIDRCAAYRRAGAHKFVLLPLCEAGCDDDLFEQTRRVVEQVIPVVHGWS